MNPANLSQDSCEYPEGKPLSRGSIQVVERFVMDDAPAPFQSSINRYFYTLPTLPRVVMVRAQLTHFSHHRESKNPGEFADSGSEQRSRQPSALDSLTSLLRGG